MLGGPLALRRAICRLDVAHDGADERSLSARGLLLRLGLGLDVLPRSRCPCFLLLRRHVNPLLTRTRRPMLTIARPERPDRRDQQRAGIRHRVRRARRPISARSDPAVDERGRCESYVRSSTTEMFDLVSERLPTRRSLREASSISWVNELWLTWPLGSVTRTFPPGLSDSRKSAKKRSTSGSS